MNRLYEARTDLGDERLKALSVKAFATEIFIYHNPEAQLT